MIEYLATQLTASAAGFGLGSLFGFAWAKSYYGIGRRRM